MGTQQTKPPQTPVPETASELTNTALAFPEPDLAGALEDLQKLVEKPKKIPPDIVVTQGFELIRSALDQGYSFTDISKVFGKRGVKISTKKLKEQYESLLERQSNLTSASTCEVVA